MQMKQVAIFADSPGWHGEALKNAFLKNSKMLLIEFYKLFVDKFIAK